MKILQSPPIPLHWIFVRFDHSPINIYEYILISVRCLLFLKANILFYLIHDKVTIISSVSDYADYMRTLFDFDAIKTLLTGSHQREPFKLLVSGLNGGERIYYLL